MYIPLILFFISFFSIIFMVGRKLVPRENEEGLREENEEFEIPYITEVGSGTIKGVKKYGHAGVVMGIRMYVKSSNSIKYSYEKAKSTVKSLNKNKPGNEKKETSKFLKGISDYKRKVKAIKHKIKQEEEKS